MSKKTKEPEKQGMEREETPDYVQATLTEYRISEGKKTKQAKVTIDLYYGYCAEYFRGFDMFMGAAPESYKKHTFSNNLLLLEEQVVRLWPYSEDGENMEPDKRPLPAFTFNRANFEKAEINVEKVGNNYIPVLRLVFEVPVDENFNYWLFVNLGKMINLVLFPVQMGFIPQAEDLPHWKNEVEE